MIYKGYTGVLAVDEESGELFGSVLGLRDEITFVGKTIEEARKCFEESVDFYIERCQANGRKPNEPFAEPFSLRLDPETHRGLAILADVHKLTMNDLIRRALADFVAANRLWANPEMEASWSGTRPEALPEPPTDVERPRTKARKKSAPVGDAAKR